MKKTRCQPNTHLITGLFPQQRRSPAKCDDCDICYGVCPAAPDFDRNTLQRDGEVVFLAGSIKDGKLRKLCHDGGVATAITQYLLSKDNRVAVTVEDESYPLKTLHTVITGKDEAVKAAGTKYGATPNVLALREGVDAVIGLGCHITAIRRAEAKGLISAPLLIGLFCMQNINYQSLLSIFEKVGVRRVDVQNMRIEENVVKIRTTGGVVDLPLEDVKSLFRSECRFCSDFTAEFADISIGSLGAPSKWSTLAIRSQRGAEIIRAVETQGFIETTKEVDTEQIKKLIELKAGVAKNADMT
jgi:coenzyme F420 hydrogenase subunit beta